MLFNGLRARINTNTGFKCRLEILLGMDGLNIYESLYRNRFVVTLLKSKNLYYWSSSGKQRLQSLPLSAQRSARDSGAIPQSWLVSRWWVHTCWSLISHIQNTKSAEVWPSELWVTFDWMFRDFHCFSKVSQRTQTGLVFNFPKSCFIHFFSSLVFPYFDLPERRIKFVRG